MPEELDILLGADAGYVLPLAVLTASIADRLDAGTKARIFVTTTDIAEADRRRVADHAHADRTEIHWLDPRSADIHSLPSSGRFTAAALFRLLMGELLPQSCHRVIYLDCDMLVRRSLVPLWNTPLDDKVAGAVPDLHQPWVGISNLTGWEKEGWSPWETYMNSGMLLVDLDAWRKEEIGAKALDYVMKYGPLPAHDQDAINVIMRGRWKQLSPEWNQMGQIHQPRTPAPLAVSPEERAKALADPAVIHYTGFSKPWEASPSPHPRANLWQEATKLTSWRSFEPPQWTIKDKIRLRLKLIRGAAEGRAVIPGH
jgi:lipopolysaccharide biosynthesis glycosyltransferase